MIGSPSVTSRTRLKRNATHATKTESSAIVAMTVRAPVTELSLWVIPC